MDENKNPEASESMVDHEDTSYNRRDGNQLHVENSSTGYSLAFRSSSRVNRTESGKPILEEQGTVQDSTVSGESTQQESVSQEVPVSSPIALSWMKPLVMARCFR